MKKDRKRTQKDAKFPVGQELSKKDGKGQIFRKRTENFSVLFLKLKRTGFVKSGLQKGQMATLDCRRVISEDTRCSSLGTEKETKEERAVVSDKGKARRTIYWHLLPRPLSLHEMGKQKQKPHFLSRFTLFRCNNSGQRMSCQRCSPLFLLS